jgi:hypothetical protein
MMRVMAAALAVVAPAAAYAPEIHRTCDSMLITRTLPDDPVIRGPFYSVVLPERRVTFELGDGVEIRGKPPFIIEQCDAHLSIRRL